MAPGRTQKRSGLPWGKEGNSLARMGRFDLLPSAGAAPTPETEGDIEISQGLDRCVKTREGILRGHQRFGPFLFSENQLKKENKNVCLNRGNQGIFRK